MHVSYCVLQLQGIILQVQVVLQEAFLRPSIQEIPITPDNYSPTINIGNSYCI